MVAILETKVPKISTSIPKLPEISPTKYNEGSAREQLFQPWINWSKILKKHKYNIFLNSAYYFPYK